MLARAGVRLIDAPGAGLFELLNDGEQVVVDGGTVRIADQEVLRGRELEVAELERQLQEQSSGSTRRWPSSPRTRSPTCARRPTC